MSEQGIFFSDVRKPRPVFNVPDTCPEGLTITLPPGSRFRIYEEDGRVSGIVVWHHTVEPDGTTFIHENDYSFSRPTPHVETVQANAMPRTATAPSGRPLP